MGKQFIELSVYTTHQASELVSDMFWNFTEQGVVINDIEDVIELSKDGKSWDYADDKIFKADKTVIVKGYFPIEDSNKIIEFEKSLLSLKESIKLDFGSLETVRREIDGDLWHTKWKEYFKPIHIGKIVVVPEWIKYEKQPDETVVLLDSNMAFGTGEHETTYMCVEFLSKYVKENQVVIDVGCGSGILGITASKLKAKEVIMTDIDECAVTATTHNMQLNKVTNGKVLLKNLLDDSEVKGNVIVCNIMAEVLIYFAPQISNNLLENGIVILSGILVDRLEKVKNAYINAGFKFVEEKIKGEWSALVMRYE